MTYNEIALMLIGFSAGILLGIGLDNVVFFLCTRHGKTSNDRERLLTDPDYHAREAWKHESNLYRQNELED